MKLPVDQIIVGERRREDMGDIDGLARSIRRYGLLHPIVIDRDRNLVAGERRLRAVQHLGWDEVEVRDLGELTEPELREIELEENLRRKDLTDYERSRTLVVLAQTAREIAEAQTKTCPESGQVSKPARGPSRTPGSIREVSDRIGRPRSTIHEAEQHVTTADTYPVMQTWPQYHVLEAKSHLEKLPEEERPKAVAIVSRPAVPSAKAVDALSKLARKPEPERERIYALQASPDPVDQDRALTEAAEVPPMPDQRLALLDQAADILNRAARLRHDETADQLRQLVSSVRSLIRDLEGKAA
jgi:hypothetical protein